MNTYMRIRWIALLALFFPVWVLASPTLLNYEWHAEVCRENDRANDCPNDGHIKDGDRFSIALNASNQLSLHLEEASTGKKETPFPLKISKLCQVGCDYPIIKATFDDKGTEKRFTMAVLRNGSVGPTSQECQEWMRQQAPENRLSAGQVMDQCAKQHLVYWHIQTSETQEAPPEDRDDTMRALSPPDDGHGTGSDGNNSD